MQSNLSTKVNRKFYISLIAFCLILVSIVSCRSKEKASNQPQPLLDSVYITQYMNSNAEYKEHLDWAKKFYKERKFTLGWFENHELVPQAEEMLAVISKSYEEGLDPKDYQLFNLEEKLKELKKADKDTSAYAEIQKQIDIDLSATYFNWASDYYRGLVIPRDNKGIEWDVKRNKIKLHKALLTVLGDRKSKYDYASFGPLHQDYANLRKALARYREIQKTGGWPVIPATATVKQGQSSPAVVLLRKRLADLIPKDQAVADSAVYSSELVTAVKKFQSLHGLKADGSIGAGTIKMMNVPIGDRIRQIILNMERWRWIPKSFEPDYLFVNIPEFKLHVYENKKEVMNMNVIVGKTMHSTPIFSDKLEHVVLSPYWNIPPGILKDEIAPKVAADPGFLDRMDMEVITYKGDQVDPGSIDWSTAGTNDFKYVVRRRPGPKNDLGDVKFIFPNENNVYLHDTPNDELFSQSKRDFSHGCVRVEEPIKLAEYLLRNVSGWDRQSIMRQVSTRKEKHVPVKEKLPVYLVYFTAKADANGNVQFYNDIYGHDKTLAAKYFSKL